jgi:hypothetical protein
MLGGKQRCGQRGLACSSSSCFSSQQVLVVEVVLAVVLRCAAAALTAAAGAAVATGASDSSRVRNNHPESHLAHRQSCEHQRADDGADEEHHRRPVGTVAIAAVVAPVSDDGDDNNGGQRSQDERCQFTDRLHAAPRGAPAAGEDELGRHSDLVSAPRASGTLWRIPLPDKSLDAPWVRQPTVLEPLRTAAWRDEACRAPRLACAANVTQVAPSRLLHIVGCVINTL